MAIKTQQRGFALLIAVIFMSVMLTFGLILGSLGYKQQVLASAAIQSQYAFYAADAALECVLYQDQQKGTFAFPSVKPALAPKINCDGVDATYPLLLPDGIVSYTPSTQWVIREYVSLDSPAPGIPGTRCAEVTIYKPKSGTGTTYIFSQGYDVSCATVAAPGGARFVARGLSAQYQ